MAAGPFGPCAPPSAETQPRSSAVGSFGSDAARLPAAAVPLSAFPAACEDPGGRLHDPGADALHALPAPDVTEIIPPPGAR